MRPSRRTLLRLIAGTAAVSAASRSAWTQAYPTRPVHLVVGYAPGGGNDIVARLMGQWLSERIGQRVVIENRPGAGTSIAAEAVANAPPDGYTLFFASIGNAFNATLYSKLKFNFIRDFVPIAGIAHVPEVMAVNPAFPEKTGVDFIAYAKAHPARINVGSAGTGSGGHLAAELFKMLAGVDMVHVPFRGNGPALAALLGGQVDLLFPTLPSSIEYIKAGKLRALGVTTAARLDALADLPTVGEFVPGYEVTAWYGLAAPAGTPAEVVERINREVNAGLADPKMKARLADLGVIPMAGSPADFAKLIADETERWAKVIRTAGIKAE